MASQSRALANVLINPKLLMEEAIKRDPSTFFIGGVVQTKMQESIRE